MTLLLLSTALAAPAAGFTTPGAVSESSAALQLIGLLDARRTYGQARFLGQASVKRIGFDVDVSALAGAGRTHWSHAAMGSARVGMRVFYGKPSLRQALGVGLRTQLGEPVGFWVLQGAHARQWPAPSVTWDLTTGPAEAPFSMRLTLGFGPASLDEEASFFGGTGAAAAKMFPVGERWSVLVEAELLVDATPLSVRGGVRWQAADAWTVDAALSVPVALFLSHPVFMPALSVRGTL